MEDEEVAALLDSQERLVTIRAPAGCGKTYQGANYAVRALEQLERGRVLILTHTHAACAVFATATRESNSRVEIKTLDAFIVDIARIYHRALDLSPDPAAWAQTVQAGFNIIAEKVQSLLVNQPMVSGALAERYPVVIGDEHQDSSPAQHQLLMCLYEAGAIVRLFGDRMQTVYGNRTKPERQANQALWDELKDRGSLGSLSTPHRWRDGSIELGEWILDSREALEQGKSIDLRKPWPEGLEVLRVIDTSRTRNEFRVEHRRALDEKMNQLPSALVLSRQNDLVKALRVFWNRRHPIWEGHTRYALSDLLDSLVRAEGNCVSLAMATVRFVQSTCKGFSNSSHADRFIQQVEDGCVSRTRGKPQLLQEMGLELIARPDHIGVSRCLKMLASFIDERRGGFTEIKIDYRREFFEAIALGHYEDPTIALREINRRRAFSRPMPPDKALSTIHKAKGLECDHVIIAPCDRTTFSKTEASRCLLYVALSRAKETLTLVVPDNEPSPLLLLD